MATIAFLVALATCSTAVAASSSFGSCTAVADLVRCHNTRIPSLPIQLQSGELYPKVDFRNNLFDSRTLLRRNLTAFMHVEHLAIVACGIEFIEASTFSDMPVLKWLDLSENNIRRIEARTFDRLSLDHLFMNKNPNLMLVDSSFTGLRLTGLYLSQCGLESFGAAMISPLLAANLRVLWLDGNRLRAIEPALVDAFLTLDTVRLGDNRLDCSCRLQWLRRELLDTSSTKFVNTPQVRCAAPPQLAGRVLTQVGEADMRCEPHGLDLVIAIDDGGSTRAVCTSLASPTTALVLTRPDGEVAMSLPRSGADVARTSSVEIVAPLMAAAGIYRCISSSDAGNQSATVNLSWPAMAALLSTAAESRAAEVLPQSQPLPTVCHDRASSSEDLGSTADQKNLPHVLVQQQPPAVENSAGSRDVFTAKYFSLVDVLGAAFGTFAATLVTCVLVLHFCVYKRRGAPASFDSSAPSSDYSAASSFKGYPPPLRTSSSATGSMSMRPLPPTTHFKHQNPMFDENHYMTTNLEEMEFLSQCRHPPCEACRTMCRTPCT